jgi:hypothetical protein
VTWVFDVFLDCALDAWTVAFGPPLVTAADCPFADASAHLPSQFSVPIKGE